MFLTYISEVAIFHEYIFEQFRNTMFSLYEIINIEKKDKKCFFLKYRIMYSYIKYLQAYLINVEANKYLVIKACVTKH